MNCYFKDVLSLFSVCIYNNANKNIKNWILAATLE